MSARTFVLEMDDRRVVVDRESQQVAILDAEGAVVFRDRIQVAAVSKQGIASMLESATTTKNA